jgi:molybdopterin-dependent oxidoreductase alpha subunit
MSKDKRNISVIGPHRYTNIKLTDPKSFAAGMPGVQTGISHALKEMGLAKSVATLSKINQKDGFDCPGCAWPDPEKRSSLGEFCENGVKAVSEEATNKCVDSNFFRKHSITELSNWTDFQIGKSGRLTDPVILKPGSHHYESLSWDEAFELIAENLKALNDPNEAIFYTSGRSSNEAAFLYGLFIRAFGTNNMPDCSNMCHESSGIALSETLGIGKGSVILEDFADAEVIIIIGQNPGTNHPRMLTALEKCKENGGKVITINPLEEAGLVRFKNPQKAKGIIGGGISITDIFLQVKINQDVSLLKLIMKKLAKMDRESGEVFDHEFIKTQTKDFDELLKNLEMYEEDDLLKRCGVSAKSVDEAVNLLAEKKRIIICWAMGLTQHKNGVENIKECVNLLLLKGSIGKKGAGTCPVRGHSNVQGDRTVGITHHVSKILNESYRNVFGFIPPEKEGLDTVKSIKAMHEGKAKMFLSLGGNFLSAASDTLYTGEALQNCDLTVSISTKLNRTHLVPGKTSLILPTLGRSERDEHQNKNRFVTVENSMGRVHKSQGKLKPISAGMKSECEIIAGIASAFFKEQSNIDWKTLGTNYSLIRQKISQVFSGFDNYTERSQKEGFYLPNNARIADFSKLPKGKAVFTVCILPEHNLTEGEFLLTTIRSHDQFNTTIYGLDDRYRGIYNERRVVFINPDDANKLNFKKLDKIDLLSNYNGIKRRAKNFLIIPYNIPRGNLAAYFPETNILIPHDEYADKSNTPISKSVKVTIESANS